MLFSSQYLVNLVLKSFIFSDAVPLNGDNCMFGSFVVVIVYNALCDGVHVSFLAAGSRFVCLNGVNFGNGVG